MDIIGNRLERHERLRQLWDVPTTALRDRRPILSQQVSDSHYFFLNRSRRDAERWVLPLGGREHCNPDYAIDREAYTYLVLEYVAQGEGKLELDGVVYDLGPGSLFVSLPTTGCVMRTDREKRMIKYFLCIANRNAPRRLLRFGLIAGVVRTLAAHGEIRSVFEEIIREGRHSSVRASEICAVLFDLLLLKIADAFLTEARPSEPARENFLRCKALMDTQAERFASLRDVAMSAGLDVSSVCRLFRRFHGTSPYQYLLRRKMNLAAEFLVQHGGLVKEAALLVGFADAYHFSRCFKATHGIPPSEVRRHR